MAGLGFSVLVLVCVLLVRDRLDRITGSEHNLLVPASVGIHFRTGYTRWSAADTPETRELIPRLAELISLMSLAQQHRLGEPERVHAETMPLAHAILQIKSATHDDEWALLDLASPVDDRTGPSRHTVDRLLLVVPPSGNPRLYTHLTTRNEWVQAETDLPRELWDRWKEDYLQDLPKEL